MRYSTWALASTPPCRLQPKASECPSGRHTENEKRDRWSECSQRLMESRRGAVRMRSCSSIRRQRGAHLASIGCQNQNEAHPRRVMLAHSVGGLSMLALRRLFCTNWFIPRFDLGLVVQNHVQQGIMDFQFSIVFDKAQFSEFVHEKSSRALASCRSSPPAFPD